MLRMSLAVSFILNDCRKMDENKRLYGEKNSEIDTEYSQTEIIKFYYIASSYK